MKTFLSRFNIKAMLFAYCTACICMTASAQTGDITSSIPVSDPIFVQGIDGFENILTISNAPANTDVVWLCVFDGDDEVLDSVMAEADGADWIDTMDMGGLASEAVSLEARFYDANGDWLDNSNRYGFSIKPEPEALASDYIEITVDSIDAQGIAYMEYTISFPDSSGEVDGSIVGLGGRKFGFSGAALVLKREYDLADGTISGSGNSIQYSLDAFGLTGCEGEIDLTGNANIDITIDNDLNPVIEGHISDSRRLFSYDMPEFTLPLPMIQPGKIEVGAGISVDGGISSDLYIGLDNNGGFGFVEGPNGGWSNAAIGARIDGTVRVTGSLVNKHIAGIRAALTATGRIGASYSFKTVPGFESQLAFGGDLQISGKVTLTGAVGWLKKKLCGAGNWCEANNEIADGIIWPRDNNDQPMPFGDGLPGGLDSLLGPGLKIAYNLNSRSDETDSSAFFDIPDYNPQPAFGNRGGMLGVAWIESDSMSARLLYSVLDTNLNRFSQPVEVNSSGVFLESPKVAIAPDGTAIIVWTQGSLDIDMVDDSYDLDSIFDNLEVWYAVYNPISNAIVNKSKVYGADGLDLPASMPGIAISDSGVALLTWLAEDTAGNTDIWYTELESSNGIWYQSSPDIINDMPGNNYAVQVCFMDPVHAIAAWIADSDGDDSIGGNQVVVSYYDGEAWSGNEVLADDNGDEVYNELSMHFNGDYGAIAYTSTLYTEDGEETNSIKAEIYYNGEWDEANYFEYSDSMANIRLPKVSISDMGFAAVSYHSTDIYSENGVADAGEVNIALKDLNGNGTWQSVDFSTEIAGDTSIFVWDMDVLLARDNTLYTLSQEQDTIDHELYGGQYTPVTGLLFGKPEMGLVLRGMKVNPNLTVEANPTASLPATPTGLSEIKPKSHGMSLLVYPNPAHDKLTIEYSMADSGNASLSIWDMLGQEVAVIDTTNLLSNNGKIQYSLPTMPKGVYLVKLSTPSQSKCVRIIIQ